MNYQRTPFPRTPFPRGGRGRGHVHPGSRGSRPPAPGKYHERGTPSPVTNNPPAMPRHPAPVQKPCQPAVAPTPYNCSELLKSLESIQQVPFNHFHPGSRGSRPPARRKYHEKITPSPVTNNPPAAPRPPVPVVKPSQPTVAPSPYNCSELVETLKSIQQVVQCCSCHKNLRSARTCAAGHGVCWNCKNRCNKVCPVCSSVIGESKPIMLNNIIKLLPRPCNYSEKGCDHLVLASDINHESFCRYRQVTCRIPTCGVTCMAKDLLRHLEDFHGKDMIREPKYSSIMMGFDARIERNGLAVIVAYNNIIWQHIRSGNNTLLHFFQYVPMEKPRAKFSVELEFHTPEMSFSATTPIHTDMFDPNQLFKDKETFCLPHKVATSFNNFYGGVNYSFKITKEDL